MTGFLSARPGHRYNPFAVGLRAFVGENGSGKSLAAVATMAQPALRGGYPVVSNINLYPERVGLNPELFIPLNSWRDIPYLGVQKDPADSLTGNRPCVLLLDEITSCLPARQTLNVPAELLRVLDQFRKMQCAVAVTAPTFQKIDKFLRTNIQAVTVSEGAYPDRWRRDAEGKKLGPWVGPWAPYRAFRWYHYNAFEFEDFDKDTIRKTPPVAWDFYWRTAPWANAHSLYDTREHVRLLDLVDAGVCAHCGLKTKAQYCDGKHGPAPADRAPRRGGAARAVA